MIAPETPVNDRDRLQALWALEILDTPAEERYDRIVRIAGLTLETPIVYLSFVDENRQWLKANVGMPLRETDRKISFCGHTILEDRPLVIPDTAQDPRFHDNPMVTGDPFIRFYAGVPLRSVDGHKVGTLCVADNKPRSMTDASLELLAEFAALVERELQLVDVIDAQQRLLEIQTALAETRKHMAEELAKAAGYVRGLLPKPLENPIGIDWRHLPSAQLGGDIFDYFPLDASRTAIYLLDVAGHGVGSALLSVSLMNVVRSRSLPGVDFSKPDEVLAGLNREFRMAEHDNKFFTMWYGVYEEGTRSLTHANGGHPPPVLIYDRVDGRNTSKLEGSGLIVGALPEASYEACVLSIQEPCALYVFSDGVYEIFPPGDEDAEHMLGYDGFAEILTSADGDLDAVIERLREYAGGTFDDDVSLMRLRLGS